MFSCHSFGIFLPATILLNQFKSLIPNLSKHFETSAAISSGPTAFSAFVFLSAFSTSSVVWLVAFLFPDACYTLGFSTFMSSSKYSFFSGVPSQQSRLDTSFSLRHLICSPSFFCTVSVLLFCQSNCFVYPTVLTARSA